MKKIGDSVLIQILFGLSLTLIPSHGAKILSLNFMAGKSHKITYDPLLNELASRGHDVTIVSQVPSQLNRTNPRDVLTYNFMDILKKVPDMYEMKIRGEELNPLTLLNVYDEVCRAAYALPELQAILREKYDLVFHEPFFNECAAGFIHKLNTSLVLITPISTPSDVVRLLGGPAPPSFIPSLYSPFETRMSFVERTKNLLIELAMGLLRDYYYLPRMEALYREALNDSSLPGVADVYRNASLILSNSHIVLGGARPFMPDIVEVGGMHMRKAKPLPKNLEDFAQSSGEHGFIFFSMGSVFQGSQIPEKYRKILLNAFSQLKQSVLWKWEAEGMTDLPPNVKLIKWAPQQEVLGHPKIAAFITHGGLGSTTEAIFHGVPFIGIPMAGDQPMNMEKFVRAGVARRLEFTTMTEADVLEAIDSLLSDPKYSRNVKQMSRIFRDQRDDPLERAVFWTEYVLRHKGAVHLRSPARDLNFFQYHSLDVISVFVAGIALAIFILHAIVKTLFKLCFMRTLKANLVSNGKKYN